MITTINGHKTKPRRFDCRFFCTFHGLSAWLEFDCKEVIERNSFQRINFICLVFFYFVNLRVCFFPFSIMMQISHMPTITWIYIPYWMKKKTFFKSIYGGQFSREYQKIIKLFWTRTRKKMLWKFIDVTHSYACEQHPSLFGIRNS